jgi:hypothetical protein
MRNLTITILGVLLVVMVLISPGRAEMATSDEALTIANNWISLIIHLKGDWGGATTTKIKEIQELKRGKRILGYVCLVEPDGFIVVSVHKELAPVKAYSAYSNMDPQPDQGLADLIKGCMERVVVAVEKHVGPMASAKSRRIREVLEVDYHSCWGQLEVDAAVFKDELKSGKILLNYQGGKVLLSSAWDQNWPYNDQCPGECPSNQGHAVAGCIAIAGAQTARYWSWPPYGVESPCDDPYDWPNMPDVLTVNSPQAQIDATAELISDMGWAVDMDYGCDSSSAYFADLPGDDLRDAFEEHFRYNIAADAEDRDDYSADGWFNLLKEQFNLNRPLPYAIASDPGHAIVADGWQEVGGQKQYHMNWGHGPTEDHNGHSKNWWYTLDAIYGSDASDEEVLMNLNPSGSLGSTLSGTYSLNASFPYRYFDQDAAGSSATFAAGHLLQFLPGIKVTGAGTGGNSVRFTGSSSNKAHLFSGGDLSKGIRIDNGTIKLTNNGSITLEPLGAPRYLRTTAVGRTQVNITWEEGHGDEDGFEVERKLEMIPDIHTYNHLATVSTRSYMDPTVSPNTIYLYRIRAVKLGGARSKYSNIAWVLTSM